MKNLSLPLYFFAIVTILVSCKEEDIYPSVVADNSKLYGEWHLSTRLINNTEVSYDEYACYKYSAISFEQDNYCTMSLAENIDPLTRYTLSFHTYTLFENDSIGISNPDVFMKLVDNKLHVRSYTRNDDEQVDIFIHEKDEVPDSNYDGSEVIAKLKGIWKITNVTDTIEQQNIFVFKTPNEVKFTQYKSSYNQEDLDRFNVELDDFYPFYKKIERGYNNTIIFNQGAANKFTWIRILDYVVMNANTVKIKNDDNLTIKILDDTTFELHCKNEDSEKKSKIYTYLQVTKYFLW